MMLKRFKSACSRSVIGALADDTSGVALTEFAFTAPIFLTLGLVGSDTVSYVIAHMRISQVALHVADNASRIGEQDVLVERRIFERDINDLLTGAERYAKGLDLNANGRIILSSLEMNDEGGQWIHWQRCKGQKDHDSQYGVEDDGIEGTDFPGMGEPGAEITASGPDEAVMFVEVAYDYQPLGPISTLEGKEITYTASFNVRDNRDLSQIHPDTPVGVTASCD